MQLRLVDEMRLGVSRCRTSLDSEAGTSDTHTLGFENGFSLFARGPKLLVVVARSVVHQGQDNKPSFDKGGPQKSFL